MRKTFEAEIQQLKDELLLMGSMVEQQILDSVEALKKRDMEASHRIYERRFKDQFQALWHRGTGDDPDRHPAAHGA